jgi:hypothetical protein
VDRGPVKEVIKDISVEIQGSDLSEVSEEVIMARVKKAGGANYDGSS